MNKLIYFFLLLFVVTGFSQGRKVETDTLKARAAFKIKISGTWYDRTSFFSYLNASNKLIGSSGIQASSITNTEIVNPYILFNAADGLTGSVGSIYLGSSILLNVNVDNSTIEISDDTLNVKDGGITNTKLQYSSMNIGAGDGLAGGGITNLGESVPINVNVDSPLVIINDTLNIADSSITWSKLDTAVMDSIRAGGTGGLDSATIRSKFFPITDSDIDSLHSGNKVKGSAVELNPNSILQDSSGLKVRIDTVYFQAAGISGIDDIWYSKNGGVTRFDWEFNQGITGDTIYYPMPQCEANGYIDAWSAGGGTLKIFNIAGDLQTFNVTADSTRYTINLIIFASPDSVYLSVAADDTVYVDNLYLTSPRQLTLKDSSVTGQKIAAGTITYEHANQALKDSIDSWKTNVDDTTDLKSFNGERIYLDKLATGLLGGGWFVKGDSAYKEGAIAFNHPVTGSQWIREDFLNGHNIYAEWAGAIGGDSNDDTAPLWKCLNLIETTHANTLIFPEDTVFISIANSENTYSCLVIPSNTTIAGRGIDKTIIKRVAGERNQHGLLMVTKDWDTATGWDGASNIVFENFTITDGDSDATTPGNYYGDLIAIGHAQDIIVRNVKALNHDQHFVDITGSRRVTIEHCYSDSRVENLQGATFQIDMAEGGSIWGINADNTGCESIRIINNTIINCKAYHMIHFHRDGPFHDIIISNNIINVTAEGSENGIGSDADCNIYNLLITNNIFNLDSTQLGRALYLGSDTFAVRKNITFSNNIIDNGNVSVYIGSTTLKANDFLNTSNVLINNNQFYADWRDDNDYASLTNVRVIGVDGVQDVMIIGNNIKVHPDYPKGTPYSENIIYLNSNRSMFVKNNRIELLSRADSAYCYGIHINQQYALGKNLVADILIDQNDLYGDGWRYGIIVDAAGAPQSGEITGRISRNFVHTTDVIFSQYAEQTFLSDGTNNLHWVEWPASIRVGASYDSIYFAAITDSMTVTDIPLKYAKIGLSAINSGFSYEMWYYPPVGGFWNYAQTVGGLQYVSADSVIGIQAINWRADASGSPDVNEFDLITGNAGVHISINTTTWAPVIRKTGYLKMRVGL